MPEYSYRREDGTVFTIRQKFSDDPLTVDPETGQKVKRIVHAAGIIFKGSGFYVNDSKKSSQHTLTPVANDGDKGDKKEKTATAENGSKSTESASDTKTESKSTESSKSSSKETSSATSAKSSGSKDAS